MTAPFDILQLVPVDRVLWRGTATTLEEARVRVRELAEAAPGKYLILCVQTGTGLVINTDDADITALGRTRRRRVS